MNWVDKVGGKGPATTFDFTTKGILNVAVEGELWRLRGTDGKAPGMIGWWPAKAVTFVDNHDTGSTQHMWPFPSDRVMQGYAYILTHPGTPCIVSHPTNTTSYLNFLFFFRERRGFVSARCTVVLSREARACLFRKGKKTCSRFGFFARFFS